MDFSAIVEQTAKAAENNIPKEPCDYYGKDGLLRCGKCGTPKEHKTPPEFGSITVRCLCECEAKKREELKRKLARQNRQERLRNEAFNNQMMLENTFTADDGANPVLMTAARNYAEKFDIFKKMQRVSIQQHTDGYRRETLLPPHISESCVSKPQLRE